MVTEKLKKQFEAFINQRVKIAAQGIIRNVITAQVDDDF